VTALLEKGDDKRALIALDACVKKIPGNTVPRSNESVVYVEAYYQLGQQEKAMKIIDEIMYRTNGSLQWYASMKPEDMVTCGSDIRDYMNTEIQILDIYQRYDRVKYKALLDKLIKLNDFYMSNGVNFGEKSNPLDYLMRVTMRGFYLSGEDTVIEKEEHAMAERIAGLMQRYNPKLLQKYQAN
ncbi:MAG: hypothetical protein LBN74_04000, partial [Prevotella sp.]|nr:hypothetical protein [Prevotella sp.]